MQNINLNHFSQNYIKPVIDHPVAQFMIEAIKIIAAQKFLEYVVNCFFNNPSRFPLSEVRAIVILAPLAEEILFRGILLRGIHLVQNIFNECAKSSFFRNSMSPPVEVGLVYRLMDWIENTSDNSQLTLEERNEKNKERFQQIFRIHLGALIFAAAHLSNPHPNRISALSQFCWSYVGGVVYGYLTEKYQSLLPSILAHSFNNSLAIAGKFYPEFTYFFICGLFINRLAFYILGVTATDHSHEKLIEA